jgi:hypothetical protein
VAQLPLFLLQLDAAAAVAVLETEQPLLEAEGGGLQAEESALQAEEGVVEGLHQEVAVVRVMVMPAHAAMAMASPLTIFYLASVEWSSSFLLPPL